MTYIFISALLFGLVHPGSKFILDKGINLEGFCFLYILVRIIFQVPLVLKNDSLKIKSNFNLFLLVLVGLIGVVLQLSEFAGIARGLNVSIVTFLVYSHPVWTILFSVILQKEKINSVKKIKITLAIIGILFLMGSSELNGFTFKQYWPSLLAGLFIALWVVVTNISRKRGISSLQLSFYYDLFALISISLIIISRNSVTIDSINNFIMIPWNIFYIVSYSLIAGLLPNLFFYKGSIGIDATVAGLILLMEPVLASLISILVWNERTSIYFYMGAFLILIINFPFLFVFRRLKKIVSFATASLIFTLLIIAGNTFAKNIILLEGIPLSNTNSTVSFEKKQILTAARMALEDYKKENKSCYLNIQEEMNYIKEEDLIKKISSIKDKRNSIIVGISRTDFARDVAFHLKGTLIRAISVGAATSNITQINSNFISIVNPWVKQFEIIQSQLKAQGCFSGNTLAAFDLANYLSSRFKEEFTRQGLGSIKNISTIDETFDSKCIFLGTNFSRSVVFMKNLIKKKWKGVLFGVGDWNINSNELTEFTKRFGKDVKIIVPTGWSSNLNQRSQKFALKFKTLTSAPVGPLAAYTYDSVIVAAKTLCESASGKFLYRDGMTLKNYKNLSLSGNLISDMSYRELLGGQ